MLAFRQRDVASRYNAHEDTSIDNNFTSRNIMPDIAPFTPLRYNPSLLADVGSVIAPPYDVISQARRQELLDSDPYNVIQLILPQGDDDTRYDRAAATFSRWIQEELLMFEPGPAIYPYTQEFIHPGDGTRRERHGFVCVMRLGHFDEGTILPHERTLSGPKADRLKLMQATDANLEPIFGMYADPTGESAQRLRTYTSEFQPIVDVADPDGVRHILWRMQDLDLIAAFVADLRATPVVIVDGHHRYETALTYRDMMGGTGSSPNPKDFAADWIMIFLAPTSDPGLLILPTHRVVHGVPSFDLDALLPQLREWFTVSHFDDRLEALEALDRIAPDIALLLIRRERNVLLQLRNDIDREKILKSGTPDVLARLDVTILHNLVFERLLGMSKSAQEEQRNLGYVKGTDDAFAAADREGVDMVVMMNPPRLDQVVDVAASGRTMPQKSTYFYPKLASGLLFNSLHDPGATGRE